MNRKLIDSMRLSLVLIVLVPCLALAQSGMGKLQGQVTDLDTGEPLIGVNIVVENTQTGAVSNVTGDYVILSVPPGTYAVRASYVGYQPQVVRDVRVVAGITYSLPFRLKASSVEVSEITIIAERPLFEAKSTNTVKVYDSKEISQLPVRGVNNVVSLEAGVVSQEGSGGVAGNRVLNVRGGRGGEVMYIIDGVPQGDILTGANAAQVSDNAIEQVSFQVGGYEAKYGQAQSGIVNVTTRTGSAKYTLYGEAVTSEWTDDFGYNLYSANVGGPIIPDNANHTFFLSGERGFFRDANPSAIGINFTTPTEADRFGNQAYNGAPYNSKALPNSAQAVWRYTGRTYHNLGFMTIRLGGNYNTRKGNFYTHLYSKNNPEHNPRFDESNQSYTVKLGKDFSPRTFLNLTAGFRQYDYVRGDGVWFDNFRAYGDTSSNPQLIQQGSFLGPDRVGIFSKRGAVNNIFEKRRTSTLSFDADFVAQISSHLLEIGGGISLHKIRYLLFNPRRLTAALDTPFGDRLLALNPTAFGFWVNDQYAVYETAANEVDPIKGNKLGPKKPVIAYGYVQDRFELQDLVLNIGLRFDYLDSKADVLKDELLPYAYGDPTVYDAADFVRAPKEVFFSPRIGLGFPVTSTTVFHAQWGRFIQNPLLTDVYTTIADLEALASDNNLGVNTGRVSPEKTTQYEVGFRQVLGDNVAAIGITAFYKNTEDLTNTTVRFFQRQLSGQLLQYYGPSNYDFGTVKGLAFNLTIRKISYFSAAVNYTYSVAEGTGSSTTSSYVAAFRNLNGEIPIVIAPLDFDQRHTGTISLGFNTGAGELGPLENVSVSVLATFNSGRPYTPLFKQNLLAGITNYGDTKGYVNSAYGPGSLLMNVKVEKTFNVSRLAITPYVWIENVLDAVNELNVYRTTGSAYTTGWLETPDGIAASQSSPAGPAAYRSDFGVYERDPNNFGVPRQIRLGLKVNWM